MAAALRHINYMAGLQHDPEQHPRTSYSDPSHPIQYLDNMAQKYARDQPSGFTNRIERVAIVGVGLHPSSFENLTNNTTTTTRSAAP